MDAAYRVAGNLEVRVKELEDELGKTHARLHDTERALFSTRKIVRRHQAATATAWGGTAAALASVVALSLYAVAWIDDPGVLLGLVVAAFLFGAICGVRWQPVNDGFPPAPPPRMS